MTMPRCWFLASPRRNRERAAGLCASEAVAMALFREKVIRELEVVAVPVPVRAGHQMRLCAPPIASRSAQLAALPGGESQSGLGEISKRRGWGHGPSLFTFRKTWPGANS